MATPKCPPIRIEAGKVANWTEILEFTKKVDPNFHPAQNLVKSQGVTDPVEQQRVYLALHIQGKYDKWTK